MNMHDLLPTHRCIQCNAYWRYQLKRDTQQAEDAWTLKSPQAGTCCDNKEPGGPIVPITFEDLTKFIDDTPHLARASTVPAQDTSIDSTLAERGKRYGEYTGHARITQSLKRAMREAPGWANLADDQRETMEMLAHKIGRILNGDPNYHDSWHDLAGYSKLSADAVLARQKEAAP